MVCVPLASVIYADEVAKDGYLGDYGCGYVEFTNAPKVSPQSPACWKRLTNSTSDQPSGRSLLK